MIAKLREKKQNKRQFGKSVQKATENSAMETINDFVT